MPTRSSLILKAPLQGSGPGLLLHIPADGMSADGMSADGMASMAALAGQFVEEGYVVVAGAARDGAAIDELLSALRGQPQCAGGSAVVSFANGDDAIERALACPAVSAVVIYGPRGATVPDARSRIPITMHVPGSGPAVQEKGLVTVFHYPECEDGFSIAGHPNYSAAWANLAYSRTVAALKRSIGPHYCLEELWEHHLACEFAHRDATRTMQTMVPEPYVNHVPTMTGGVGHELLKRFYQYHFVNQVPNSRRTIPISRTVGADRVVDEKIFCFTHDTEIDWLLPGVPPTGRYVEIPLVGIITFRGDKLVNEHIYWDQASVLVQVGLLDPAGLPVCGVEQARKLTDKSLPSNTLMPSWTSSENKAL